MNMKYWIYPLLLILGASSYGVLSSIIKLAMKEGFTAAEAVTSQYYMGFAIVVLLVIVFARRLPKFGGGWTLVVAGLMTATTGTVYGQAVQHMPASLAVVMLFQFTWVGMLLDSIIYRRLPTRVQLASLPFLLGGTILAAGVIDVDLSSIPWQGWAWGMASAFSFSAFLMINQRQVEGMTTLTRLFYTSLFATIFISLFQRPDIVWSGALFEQGLWKFGLLLGLLGIVAPIYLFAIAVPKVGGALASILSAMELPVAVIAAVVLVGETMTPLQIVGIFIILIGIIFPTWVDSQKERTSAK